MTEGASALPLVSTSTATGPTVAAATATETAGAPPPRSCAPAGAPGRHRAEASRIPGSGPDGNGKDAPGRDRARSAKGMDETRRRRGQQALMLPFLQ